MLRRLFRRKSPIPAEIDAVYTWVDGAEPALAASLEARKQQYRAAFGRPPEPESVAARRFRDLDNLRHSLRSIAKNAPWFRRIFIVTNNQVPKWLRRESRIEIVSQADIFPDHGDLPSFNATAIEWNIPRIAGLSRHYVQINDDCFFTKPVPPDYFFGRNGRTRLLFDRYEIHHEPKDGTLWQRLMSRQHALLQRQFGDRPYYQHAHGPMIFDREALARVAALWPDGIRETRRHFFREAADLHLPTLYVNALAIMDTETASRERHERVTLSGRELHTIPFGDPEQPWRKWLEQALERPALFLCMNDDMPSEDSGGLERFHRDTIRRLFPEPSPFEQDAPVKTESR
jgi:hypothetical protein